MRTLFYSVFPDFQTPLAIRPIMGTKWPMFLVPEITPPDEIFPFKEQMLWLTIQPINLRSPEGKIKNFRAECPIELCKL